MAVTTSTTTQQQSPWSKQQPYLEYMFGQAKDLYGQGGPQYYPESTVAPFSPVQEQAMAGIQDRAMSGSPVNQAAQQQITGTLSGDYLNSNPYLDATYNKAAGAVRGSMDSQFSRGGRYGSGIHQGAMGESLSGLANNIYGDNYQAERGRQMQAIPYANQIANQDYADYGKLMDVGNVVQGQGQRVLDDNVNRFNYEQNAPYQNLGNYGSMIQGNYGENSSTTSPMYSNSGLQNALGYGMTAAGLADAFGASNGWTAGIGAGAGLLGAFI